jgi:hypothetical protein
MRDIYQDKGRGHAFREGFGRTTHSSEARATIHRHAFSTDGLEAILNRCLQHFTIFVKVIYPASREPQ